jgi:hypothetical protein
MFDCYGLDVENYDEIKEVDFNSPFSNISKALLFLFSMETFLYGNLNVAERKKNYLKVNSLGPFACVFREITRWA